MRKIDSLTIEQEKYLPVFRDEWLKIGQSTEKMNRENATNGMNEFYKWNKMAPPKVIFWGSPFSAWLIYFVDDNGTLWIDAKEAFSVTHEEHKPVAVPCGTYEVRIAKEYDHFSEEARSVAD